MDDKELQFINIRKMSLQDHPESKEYMDLCGEDPMSVTWIADEYRLVKNYLPKRVPVEPYQAVVLRALDDVLKRKDMVEKTEQALFLVTEKFKEKLSQRFRTGVITMPSKKRHQSRRIAPGNFEQFLNLISERRYFTEERVCVMCRERSYFYAFSNAFIDADDTFALAFRVARSQSVANRISKYIQSSRLNIRDHITYEIEDYFTVEYICSLLKYNRNHNLFSKISARDEASSRIRKHLLERIPDSYVDLYPDARLIKRKFYIHHGPTNSGKTYESVNRLMEAKHGIYAGPLRLLAYEVYERLNRAGTYCSLLTGEESIPIPCSTVQASTVEMVNVNEDYDIVVIDEAQLVADKFRGGSWTRVLLGVKAQEIHVCCANEAVPVLIRMITDCGDSYELISHTRNTPLYVDEREFTFPDSIEPHDALIVFSRKDVHAVAAELQRRGTKCSVIYGNLPYDVRHKEAERFMKGETKVLVSTDAIGLGLNLPIKRVVFLRLDKFDGYEMRELTAAEVKQIGGRAGRYGIYDEGFVTAEGSPEFIKDRLYAELPDIEYATIQFPETIIDIDAPMTEILRRWKDVTVNDGYRKADIEREIALCEMLGTFATDKYFLYTAITIPFDERNKEILSLWQEMAKAEYENYTLIPEVLQGRLVNGNRRLDYLERAYHVCDLLYNFAVKFKHEEYVDDIMRAKQMLSDQIIKHLSTHKLSPKKCNRCGMQIPWNSRYGMCKYCRQKAF